MKPKLISLWPALAITATIILGIALRISHIETRDYWYDEAFTGITVRQPFNEMMNIIINDVHPPLYYWLVKTWSLAAGTSPVSLRIFSVTFGVLTIIMAFIAMRHWHKRSWAPACITALVIAINPFFSNYSQEARMYTLLAFILLAGAYFLTKSWESQSPYDRFAYGLLVLAAMLTHYVGFIFVLAFVLADFWQLWSAHPSRRAIKILLKDAAQAYTAPFLGGLLWLPVFIKQAQHQQSLGWVPTAPLSRLPESLHIFLFGAPVGVPGVPPALGYRVEWLTVPTVALILTLAITALIVYLAAQKKFDRNLSFLAFMSFFPLLLTWALQFVNLQLYVERFLSGTALFLCLFLVLALTHLPKHDLVVVAVGIYAFLVVLIQPWTYHPVFPSLAETARQTLGGQTVVLSSPFDFTVIRFYLGEKDKQRLRFYNANNPAESLTNWAIIEEQDQLLQLPASPHLLITPEADKFSGYETVARVNQFSILKK